MNKLWKIPFVMGILSIFLICLVVAVEPPADKYSFVSDVTVYFKTPKCSNISSKMDFLDSEAIKKIPMQFKEWKGQDNNSDRAFWGDQIQLDRVYYKGRKKLNMQVVWGKDKDKIHMPKACYLMQRYKVENIGTREIVTKSGALTVGTLQFSHKIARGIEYYFYIWKNDERDYEEDGCTMIRITMNMVHNDLDQTKTELDGFLREIWDQEWVN